MNPLNPKHFDFYWGLVEECKKRSHSQVKKVGAIVVTPTGMISPGWNGMPSGWDNCCEDKDQMKKDEATGLMRPSTRPEVIHAERNALDKMANQGVPIKGSIVFVSYSPCFECYKAMQNLGLKALIYDEPYKSFHGRSLLTKRGTSVLQRNNPKVMRLD